MLDNILGIIIKYLGKMVKKKRRGTHDKCLFNVINPIIFSYVSSPILSGSYISFVEAYNLRQ